MKGLKSLVVLLALLASLLGGRSTNPLCTSFWHLTGYSPLAPNGSGSRGHLGNG